MKPLNRIDKKGGKRGKRRAETDKSLSRRRLSQMHVADRERGEGGESDDRGKGLSRGHLWKIRQPYEPDSHPYATAKSKAWGTRKDSRKRERELSNFIIVALVN